MTTHHRILCFVLLFSCTLARNAWTQTMDLLAEPNHSSVAFVVPIAGGITSVRGRFKDYKMELKYDTTDFTRSSVSFVIQTKSITTDIDDRDNHLRSRDFFIPIACQKSGLPAVAYAAWAKVNIS